MVYAPLHFLSYLLDLAQLIFMLSRNEKLEKRAAIDRSAADKGIPYFRKGGNFLTNWLSKAISINP